MLHNWQLGVQLHLKRFAVGETSMSALLIVGPKCTLAAFCAAPWWVTASMPTKQTDGRTGARRQTVMLRFSLDAASVINLRSSASDTQDTKPDVVEGVMRRAVLTWRGMQCIHVKHVVLFKQIVNAFDRWRHSNNIYDERVNECRSSGNRHQYEAAGSRPGNSRLLKTDHGRWTRVSRRTRCSGQRLRHSDVIASRPIAAQLRTVRLWTWRLTVSA